MNIRIKKVFTLILTMVALGLTISLAPVSTASGANDLPYVFTTIEKPGAIATQVFGINSGGEVVGVYGVLNPDGITATAHGFLLSAGVYTTLDYPGDNVLSTTATAISPAGDIVGIYSLKSPAPAGNAHGFLRTKDGEWTTVDYPIGNHLMQGGLYSILPDGTMLGCFHDGTAAAATAMYGYIVDPDGTATELDYPSGQPFSMFYGATPNGKRMVGAYRTGSGQTAHWHGFLLGDRGITALDVPGSSLTQAYSINAGGEVVGTYTVPGKTKPDPMHGFLLKTRGLAAGDGQYSTVDFPGAFMTHVRGINADSVLVGDYIVVGPDGKTYQTKGFVAIPLEQ